MRKITIITMLLICSYQLYGQTERDSVALCKKPTYFVTNVAANWFHLNFKHMDISYGLYYGIVNFPNAANNDLIKQKWGLGFRTRIALFPFLLEGGMFTNKFTVKDNYSIPLYNPDKYSLTQRYGYEYSLSFCPLPYINRLSNIIVPYIGIGYQRSQLSIEDIDYQTKSYASLALKSWKWKTGCNIYLGESPFTIFAEYEQTMNKDKIRNFNSVNIGVTFDMFLKPYKPFE